MTLYSPKIRHVWGKAFHSIILKGMNAAPLIQAYQDAESPMCIGFQYCKKLPHLIQHVLKSGNEKQAGIGLDVSGFDQSQQPWLIKAAFDILSENISFSDEKAASAWKYSTEFFIRTPVVMPEGRMWLKKLGVPSGSYFMELVDSVINHILSKYIQLRIWGETFKTYVLGDDSLIGIAEEFGFPSLVEPFPNF